MLCLPRRSTLQACRAQVDHCAPTYFVMGDGGNEEGPSTKYDKKDAVRRALSLRLLLVLIPSPVRLLYKTCSSAHHAHPSVQQQRQALMIKVVMLVKVPTCCDRYGPRTVSRALGTASWSSLTRAPHISPGIGTRTLSAELQRTRSV